jgi:hypothetical protein
MTASGWAVPDPSLGFGLAGEIKPRAIDRQNSAGFRSEAAHQRSAHHPGMSGDVTALAARSNNMASIMAALSH